jgi:hypothetical protein
MLRTKKLPTGVRAAVLTIAKAMLLLALTGIAVHLLLAISWSARVNRKLVEIRAKGEPATFADLVPKPVPDDQNAAVLYEQSFAFLQIPQYRPMQSDPFMDFFSDRKLAAKDRDALIPELRKVVAKNARALALAEAATHRPQCVFPHNWKAGGYAGLPDCRALSQVAQLFAARSAVKAHDGDIGGSVDDIILSLRVAQDAGKVPGAFFIESGVLSCSTMGLRESLRRLELSPEQSERLYRELDAIDLQPGLVRQVLTERVLSNWAFDAARADFSRFTIDYIEPDWVPGYVPGDFDKAMWRIQGAIQGPLLYRDQLVALKAWDKHLQTLDLPHRNRARRSHSANPTVYAEVSNYMLPNIPDHVLSCRDCAQADIALAQTALALKAHKRKFGSYPTSLHELKLKLGWKIPDDVFSGKPFIYKRQGEGFLLYSVWFNLKDDGGRTSQAATGSSTPNDVDQVWRFER